MATETDDSIHASSNREGKWACLPYILGKYHSPTTRQRLERKLPLFYRSMGTCGYVPKTPSGV